MFLRVVRATRWLVPTAVLMLSGCFMRNYAALSSGPTGCPASEITISQHSAQWSSETWVATCHGSRYFCTGMGQTVICNPEAAEQPQWAPPPQPQPPPVAAATVTVTPVSSLPVTVVVLAPPANPPVAADGTAAVPDHQTPSRSEIQAALSAFRDRLTSCAAGIPGTARTQLEFQGASGRPNRVTVTTELGVDAATCIGQALLDATVTPFAQASLTVDYPWTL